MSLITDPKRIPITPSTRVAARMGLSDKRLGYFERHRGGAGGGVGGGGGGGVGGFTLGGILTGTTTTAASNTATTPQWLGLGVGMAGAANTLKVSSTLAGNGIISLHDAGTEKWRLWKQTSNDLALYNPSATTVDHQTPVKFLEEGLILMTGIADAAMGQTFRLDPLTSAGGPWDPSIHAKTRMGMTTTQGFGGGIAGRGLTNDDVPTDDSINNATGLGTFTQWEGYAFRCNSFNDRGSLVGMLSSVTQDSVGGSVSVSSVSNASPTTITIPAAGTKWGTFQNGDTVLITTTGIAAIDNVGYFTVSSVSGTGPITFTITANGAPGATSPPGALVRKIIYHETDAFLPIVTNNASGAFAQAIEADVHTIVPARSINIMCSSRPSNHYSAWNAPGLFGANSRWINSGNLGIQIQNTSLFTNGTALYINSPSASATTQWKRAIVVCQNASANSPGEDVFCIEGVKGYLGSGRGITANQTVSIPARLTLGSDTAGVNPTTAADGIQFGTGSGVVTLYRSATDMLATDDSFHVAGFFEAAEQSSVANAGINTGRLYFKDNAGRADLYIRDDVGERLVSGATASALTSAASGTLTPTGSPDTLTTQTTASRYVLALDLSGMANGDVVEVRLKTKVLSGGTSREAYLGTFSNVQAQPQKYSNVVYADIECVAIVTRTAGSVSSIPLSWVVVYKTV